MDETTGKTVKVDLDRQLLKPLAGSGKMFCYDSPEYVKDMGTPARFHQVEEDYKAGRVSAKNLSNKQKAMFLDRDGTINKYVGFLRNIDDFELIDGVSEAIKKINASGYLAIVVTNQPVIARGEVTFQELEEIHNKMETLLGKEGALAAALKIYPQVLENVRVTDKKAAQNDEAVQTAIKKVAEGLGDTGRILVRESGTEPVVRVMVEAPDHDTCQKYVSEVVDVIRDRGYSL